MKQKVIIEGSTKKPEDYKIYYEEKPEDAEEHNAMRSVLYDEQIEEKRQNQISGIAHQSTGDLTSVVTEALITLYQDQDPDWFEIMKWFYYKITPDIDEEDAAKIVKDMLTKIIEKEK